MWGGVAEPFSEDRGGGFSYFRKEEKMREAGGRMGGGRGEGGGERLNYPALLLAGDLVTS